LKTLPVLAASLLLFLVFFLSAPSSSQAEKRIGIIMTGDIPYYGVMHEAFVAELKKQFPQFDEIEIILQRPFPDSISWSNAARKLIAVDVDLIVTYGLPATRAVVNEKTRIPLVYSGVYDPETAGVSGRNVTGCGFKVPLSSLLRYFRRLKEIDTISIAYSGIEEDSVRQLEELQLLASMQNIKTHRIDIRAREDVDRLSAMDDDAVFVTGSSLAHLWIDEILTIARKKKNPVADIFPDPAEAGILMTLYQPPHEQGEMAAHMASRILLGEDPQAISFHVFRDTELVFNLVEARHIGLTFPIQLVIEATRVIK
jgi:putative tryptophan/tyrosine transport system substrate-binding protein